MFRTFLLELQLYIKNFQCYFGMNGENLFVNELVVILNSDHCHKKSKGNIHFNILKETRKMTFNLVIICLFICISKCTSFWIHTESGNIENGCHFPSFEYESFVISSAWDLFSFCSDVTQVTSKWGDKKSCFYDFGYKDHALSI